MRKTFIIIVPAKLFRTRTFLKDQFDVECIWLELDKPHLPPTLLILHCSRTYTLTWRSKVVDGRLIDS